MPRWLRWWLALTLWFFWVLIIVIGMPFVLSQLVNVGEAPFTQEQAVFLSDSFPGGRFVAPNRYRWCDGRAFIYFDSRGDVWNHAESCWRIDR